MNERKWTPGPWAVKGDRGIRGANGECVASTYCAAPAEDAHLIAAAPDMYEALEAAFNYLDYDKDEETYMMVHDALAKARGENQ